MPFIKANGKAASGWRAVVLRAFLVAWLLSPLWHAPQPAHPQELEEEAPAQEPPDAEASAEEEGTAGSYLDRLVTEINRRREQAGTPPLAVAPESANAALSYHAADLTFVVQEWGICLHGIGHPPRFGSDYVAETGFSSEQRGEVIACPTGDAYWTAERVAETWWGSPHHWWILYSDPTANIVACGTYGSLGGGSAYQTVVCLTYRA